MNLGALLGRTIGRVATLVATLLGVTALVFVLSNLAPGDAATAKLGIQATPQNVAAMRAELGLDRPLTERYLSYIAGLSRGDLGQSYYGDQDVMAVVKVSAGRSAWLILSAVSIAIALSTTLSLLATTHRGRHLKYLIAGLSIGGIVVPAFCVGLILILVLAIPTGWFPVGGFGEGLGGHVRSLVLPSLTLAFALMPAQLRVLRSGLVEATSAEYVEAARSRGVSPARLLVRHALPNAALPVVTLISVQASYILFGSVIVENTFQLNGLGSTMVQAVGQRDYPIVTGITLVMALVVIVARILSDLIHAAADPRVRTS